MGRPVIVALLLLLLAHAAVGEVEPALFPHAAQHANECNGTTALMVLMDRLLAGYGNAAAVTARVDGLELWLAPVVNVDGHRQVFGGAPGWPDWRKTLRDDNGNGQVDVPADGVDHRLPLPSRLADGIDTVRVRAGGRVLNRRVTYVH